MARNHTRLGYGIQRVCSRLVIVRPPREILTRVGRDRWITACKLYLRPRGIMVKEVEGRHRRIRVVKHTTRHRRGGPLRATTFTASKRALPRPPDQQDTALIPPISDPARVHPLQVNVPLARPTPVPIGPARSLPRTRYHHTQHLRRRSLAVLHRYNKPHSRRNPKHSHPGENSTQHSHPISSARRRITNKLVGVRTNYRLATTLVHHPLRVALRRLHADHLFPSL
jgi:hypothetical protein